MKLGQRSQSATRVYHQKHHDTQAGWTVTGAAVQGRERKTMEDRLVTGTVQVGSHMFDVFAVMDGHGGSHAAELLQTNLLSVLRDSFEAHPRQMKTALTHAFYMLDHQIQDNSGSTLSVVVHERRSTKPAAKVWLAFVGDSSVYGSWFQGNRRRYRKLSTDHNVKSKREKSRIDSHSQLSTDADGYVIRQEEGLAMTRSLGDRSMGRGIVATPTVCAVSARYDELLVATDGFWDVIGSTWLKQHANHRDALQLVRRRQKEFPQHDNVALLKIVWRSVSPPTKINAASTGDRKPDIGKSSS